MPFISFPENADWNEAEQAIEFPVVVGEYQGRCFVPLRMIRQAAGRAIDLGEAVTEFWHHRTWFELAVTRRIEARALDDDGNIRLKSGDLQAVRPSMAG